MGFTITIIGIICLVVVSLVGITISNLYYMAKRLEEEVLVFKSKPTIKKYPLYVKLDSNLNPRVYKIRDILIVPQNSVSAPELCLVITGKDKDGNTYNATIDKFVTATEEEYNKNKKEELEF